MVEGHDVTGPLPRLGRDPAEIVRRADALLDEVAARSAADLRTRVTRLRVAAPLIAQSAIAAGGAWYLARRIGGGSGPPFFAPVAAVVSIGSALGQRLRRTVELVVGVALGVGMGDLLVRAIGNGTAALVVVVALAMALAVLLDGGQLLVLQAATSSVLVATLVPAHGGGVAGLDRCANAFIGGCVGIGVGLVLLPLNPLVVARRAVGPVTEGTAAGLEAVAAALASCDVEAASAALRQLRELDGLVAAMSTAVATSEEVAAVAPIRWRARDRFTAYATAAPQLDYAVRNSRVLARRATVLLRAGDDCPAELGDSIRLLATGARRLGSDLGGTAEFRDSRRLLVEAFAQARAGHGPAPRDSVLVLVAQIRSVVYDLLRATGLTRGQALALLEG